MDSLSQFALGAAIGEATLGRSIGRKAILVGGALGTLPDLDVLVRYADAVESFTYHRAWSHSLFVLILLSPLIALLLSRFYPSKWIPDQISVNSLTNTTTAEGRRPPVFSRWWLCVFLVLTTHTLLDAFTVYGTQLLWPLPVEPVAWSSIFIIDPLYTLPLVVGIWIAWKNRRRAEIAVLMGLLLSTLYLGFSLMSKQHARSVAMVSLEAQGLSTDNVFIGPSPFSLLWRIVSMGEETYSEGFYSLLDDNKQLTFKSYDNNRKLIAEHYDHWPVSRLDWFTGGMISANVENNALIINDLRMGVEGSYIFGFSVGEFSGTEFEPGQSTQLPVQIDSDRMKRIAIRTWDEQINVDP